MRDISTQLALWHAGGEDFALATVVRTWRSSPRMPGASMAVSRSGEVVGSVSGGCIESALYEIAQEVLAAGVPQRQLSGNVAHRLASRLHCRL